jgi:hypothetical protein
VFGNSRSLRRNVSFDIALNKLFAPLLFHLRVVVIEVFCSTFVGRVDVVFNLPSHTRARALGFFDKDCLGHQTGEGHQESPLRQVNFLHVHCLYL